MTIDDQMTIDSAEETIGSPQPRQPPALIIHHRPESPNGIDWRFHMAWRVSEPASKLMMAGWIGGGSIIHHQRTGFKSGKSTRELSINGSLSAASLIESLIDWLWPIP